VRINNEVETENENEVDLLEYVFSWVVFLVLPIGFFIFGIWAFMYGSKSEIGTAIISWILTIIIFPIVYKKEYSKMKLKKN
jgi:positive regulator of sigma E activity